MQGLTSKISLQMEMAMVGWVDLRDVLSRLVGKVSKSKQQNPMRGRTHGKRSNLVMSQHLDVLAHDPFGKPGFDLEFVEIKLAISTNFNGLPIHP